MAPIILFTFGPEESFCFYSPTKTIKSAFISFVWTMVSWLYSCTDLSFTSHRTNYAFTKTIPPRLHLPYSVSLGPADNEYCAFYVGRNHELNYSISSSLPAVSFASSSSPSILTYINSPRYPYQQKPQVCC
jgi:hypothetical protein